VAESKASSKGGKRRAESARGGGRTKTTTKRLRSILASAVWFAAVLCALTLALGALVVALDFNRDNIAVDTILTMANTIDFGVFKDFDPGKGASKSEQQSAQTKSVMVNWGLAALIYLVVGKVLDRLVRPRA
jgi:hypothetical protein